MTGQAPLSKQDSVGRARRLHRAGFLRASRQLAGRARVWAGADLGRQRWESSRGCVRCPLCPWPHGRVPVVPSPGSPWCHPSRSGVPLGIYVAPCWLLQGREPTPRVMSSPRSQPGPLQAEAARGWGGERTAPHGTSGGCRCHSVTSCPAAPRQELSLGSKSLSEEQRGSWGGAGVGDPQQQLWKKGLGPSTRTRGCQGERRRQVPKMLLSPRAPGPAAPWDDGGNGRPASTRAPC